MKKAKSVEIDTEHLKALYFVKKFKGNKLHNEQYRDQIPWSGRKIQVKHIDGEAIIVCGLNYNPERAGFFVVPADVRSNNDRIFVLRAATTELKLL